MIEFDQYPITQKLYAKILLYKVLSEKWFWY